MPISNADDRNIQEIVPVSLPADEQIPKVWGHAGACGLVSGDVYLLPKLAPLSDENMIFKLSFPLPFQPR